MPVVSNDFSDIVYNRRSIRNFDPSVKIPREELLEILDKTVTAPSSVNMQPWRFVVVDSEEGKEKLTPFVSYNGVQNETSSAMVLIFAESKRFPHFSQGSFMGFPFFLRTTNFHIHYIWIQSKSNAKMIRACGKIKAEQEDSGSEHHYAQSFQGHS